VTETAIATVAHLAKGEFGEDSEAIDKIKSCKDAAEA
jgi:hypothetical protein